MSADDGAVKSSALPNFSINLGNGWTVRIDDMGKEFAVSVTNVKFPLFRGRVDRAVVVMLRDWLVKTLG